MTAASRRHSLTLYDTHPSLSASLESFSPRQSLSLGSPTMQVPQPHQPSYQGDGSEPLEASATSRLSPDRLPPGWPYNSVHSWYQTNPQFKAKSESPRKESQRRAGLSRGRSLEDPVAVAAAVALPRGSLSPDRESAPPGLISSGPGRATPAWKGQPLDVLAQEKPSEQMAQGSENTPRADKSYFHVNAQFEMRQHLGSLESFLEGISGLFSTRRRTLSAVVVALLSFFMFRFLTRTPVQMPSPDLVRIAGFARHFEPMIYYSENGIAHVNEIQETSLAVWDLSETVRYANMTSAPIIVGQLEELSESLRTLSHELTQFFSSVDGDVDNILIVMDWAKRQLASLPPPSQAPLSTALANVHDFLSRTGFLANRKTGDRTSLGTAIASVLGTTTAERHRIQLKRSLNDMLNTFEDAISNELSMTMTLFALFENIDKQFQNLQRTTVREADTQEKMEGELLSGLWARTVGANRSRLKKFEKNKALLHGIREHTKSNRHLVEEHNKKLQILKFSLEGLRRRLVSPLLRDREDSHISMDEQIRGIATIWEDLRTVREAQKTKFMQSVYNSGHRNRDRQVEGGRLGLEA